MTDTRARVARTVAETPGIHFNGLVRRLDIAPGQAQYHLRRLRRAGELVGEPLYGRTHYFTPEYNARERAALAVVRRETARDVLLYLVEHGPSPPGAVAADLEVARSTLEHHLDHLVEQGLVDRRRDDRNRVRLTLTDPERTLDLLATIRPSLPDRFVDRFTRLIDRLVDA